MKMEARDRLGGNGLDKGKSNSDDHGKDVFGTFKKQEFERGQ